MKTVPPAYGQNPHAERLADIQAHLKAGGKVMAVGYGRCTIYSQKNVEQFMADSSGLYVRRGKSKDCLNFTPIRFSVLQP